MRKHKATYELKERPQSEALHLHRGARAVQGAPVVREAVSQEGVDHQEAEELQEGGSRIKARPSGFPRHVHSCTRVYFCLKNI